MCAIPGCQTGYKKTNNGGESFATSKSSMFKFPKNVEMKQKVAQSD